MQVHTSVISRILHYFAIALFAVVALSFLFRWAVKEPLSPPNLFSDFPVYYYAAQVLRDGGNAFDAEELYQAAYPERGELAATIAPFRHSAFILLPVIPLLSLEYRIARSMWIVGVVLASMASIYVLMKYFSPWPMFHRHTLFFGALVMLYAPFVYSLGLHQINIFGVLLVLLGALAWRKQHIWLAGILFGLAIAVKIFLAPIALVLLFQKQWKLAAVTCAIAAIAFLGPLFFFHGSFAQYIQTVIPEMLSGGVQDNPHNPVKGAGSIAWWKNISLQGAAHRLWTDNAVVHPLYILPSVAWSKWLGLGTLLFSLGTMWKRRRWLRELPQTKVLFGFGILLMSWFLLSPLTWQHHLMFLLVPVIGVFSIRAHQRIPAHLMWIGVFGLLGTHILATPESNWTTLGQQLYVLIPTIGLLLVWCAGVSIQWRIGRTST